MPHPIERLRWVARAEGAGPTLLGREAAAALAAIGDDVAGLVTGCRRLIDRHVSMGTLWWLGARVLAANDPSAAAWEALAELDGDPTPDVLAAAIPDGAVVTILGWPEQVGDALRRRGDVEALVVDAGGEGVALARRLSAAGSDAFDVREAGLGQAVLASSLVLLEATVAGPDAFAAPAGSLAAAAVGYTCGIEVWVVVGTGRVLPAALWAAVEQRLAEEGDAGELDHDVVPLSLVTAVAGPGGVARSDGPLAGSCPVAPELLRRDR